MVIHMKGSGEGPLCGNVKVHDPATITNNQKNTTCANCKKAIKAGIVATKKEAKK